MRINCRRHLRNWRGHDRLKLRNLKWLLHGLVWKAPRSRDLIHLIRHLRLNHSCRRDDLTGQSKLLDLRSLNIHLDWRLWIGVATVEDLSDIFGFIVRVDLCSLSSGCVLS